MSYESVKEDTSEPKGTLAERMQAMELSAEQIDDNVAELEKDENIEDSKNENDEDVFVLDDSEDDSEENQEPDIGSDGVEDGNPDEIQGGSDDEILQKAISMGYSPNFKGKNAKTPEEFIEAAESNPKIMTERYNNLHKDYQDQTETVKYLDNVNKLLMRQLDKDIKDTEKNIAEARDYGDFDEYEQQKKVLEDLEKERDEISSPPSSNSDEMTPDQISKAGERWASDSAWFGKPGYEKATEAASKFLLDEKDSRQKTGKVIKSRDDFNALISDMESVARKVHPEEFYSSSPTKKKAPPVSSGSKKPAAGSKGKTISLSSLPPSEQKVINHMQDHWRRSGKTPDEVKKETARLLKNSQLNK